ncbi:MAG: hypothetical protein K5872_04245 [Rhizobiaceae bacterium]|nr:hypothetical protein [Rhizobiaceae bacterium]MCV0405421.1 hypothetical protein [Rhizobiaceae bacterium]
MTDRMKVALMGATAGLLMTTGPLHAQEQLADEEVRGFFDTMQQIVTESVEAGEFDRLLDWTENHIADGATFAASNELYVGEDRKGFGVVSLDKEDMMRFGRMALGMMSGTDDQPIENYSLQIEVSEVAPAGPDAATVKVDYVESATFAVPETAGARDELQTSSTGADAREPDTGGDGTAQAGKSSVEFTATANCEHLVTRGKTGGELVIGLSTCEVRTEL